MQVWKKAGSALCAAMCIVAFSTTVLAQLEWQELGPETLGSLIPKYSSFGHSVAAMGDIDGDGLPELGVGAAGENQAGNNGKAHFLWLDAAGQYKKSKQLSYPSSITSNGGAWFGASLAHIADIDVAGNAFKLVAVGAPHSRPQGISVQPGAAFVYSMFANAGDASGDIVNAPVTFGDTPNLKLIPGQAPLLAAGYNNYGWSLAGLGDLDAGSASDGWGLAVGEPNFSGGGRVWVHKLAVDVFGNVSVTNTIEINGNTAPFAPGDIASGDDFGYSVAGVGDIDGNSVPDLAVGAQGDNDLGAGKGEVWILYLNADGSVLGKDRLSSLLTPGALAGKLGYALAAAGDVDGNGTPDLVSSAKPAGEVATFRLDYNGTSGLSLLGVDLITSAGDCTGDCPDGVMDDFGCSVAVLQDFDGNGGIELIVGARDTTNPGQPAFTGAIWFLWDREPTPWIDLRDGLAGTHGVPSLTFSGSLQAGYPMYVELSDALSNTNTYLVVGFNQLNAPFKGGVMVPSPDLYPVFGTDSMGGYEFFVPWPAGIPSGFVFYAQAWLADSAGPAGFAASNAIQGTAP